MAERINAVKTSFFGKGAIRLLGPELQKMGIRRALLVTDRFLYDSGAAARVGQVLSDAGVEYAVYYNVQPNPTVQVVNDCIAAARTLQVQLLVALGGGSAIQCQFRHHIGVIVHRSIVHLSYAFSVSVYIPTHSSSLISLPSAFLVVSASIFSPVSPSRAIMVSSTEISVEISSASLPKRLSSCFSKAVTMVPIIFSTRSKVLSIFSPLTPVPLMRS